MKTKIDMKTYQQKNNNPKNDILDLHGVTGGSFCTSFLLHFLILWLFSIFFLDYLLSTARHLQPCDQFPQILLCCFLWSSQMMMKKKVLLPMWSRTASAALANMEPNVTKTRRTHGEHKHPHKIKDAWSRLERPDSDCVTERDHESWLRTWGLARP